MDYMEQFSWLLFLKSFEETAYASVGLSTGNGRAHDRIPAGEYRWSAWAGPDRGLTGETLWRAIGQVLSDMGFETDVQTIERQWRALVSSLGASEPTNFHLAYPANLLEDMQRQIRRGLESLGVALYHASSQDCGSGQRLADLLNQAWTKFWQDPAKYADRESERLQR